MRRIDEFGPMLRGFRGRLSPAVAGLAGLGPAQRRVPGLRRDELAGLAGLSEEHLRRLEQGRRRPSAGVVDALAAALRLGPGDHQRLCLAAGFAGPLSHPPAAAPPPAGTATSPPSAIPPLAGTAPLAATSRRAATSPPSAAPPLAGTAPLAATSRRAATSPPSAAPPPAGTAPLTATSPRAGTSPLAGAPQPGGAPSPAGAVPGEVTPAARRLLERLTEVPACVCDAAWTVLAGNATWTALGCGAAAGGARERNMAWRIFTGAPTTVFRTPEGLTAFRAALVTGLRAAARRYPADARLRSLVGELRAISPDFERLWHAETVDPGVDRLTVRHPRAGSFHLDKDVLIVEPGDLRVVVLSAPPGSGDARLLAAATA